MVVEDSWCLGWFWQGRSICLWDHAWRLHRRHAAGWLQRKTILRSQTIQTPCSGRNSQWFRHWVCLCLGLLPDVSFPPEWCWLPCLRKRWWPPQSFLLNYQPCFRAVWMVPISWPQVNKLIPPWSKVRQVSTGCRVIRIPSLLSAFTWQSLDRWKDAYGIHCYGQGVSLHLESMPCTRTQTTSRNLLLQMYICAAKLGAWGVVYTPQVGEESVHAM